jgi:hypothetical protein
MSWDLRVLTVASSLLLTLLSAETSLAQRSGGVLKIYHRDGGRWR